MKTLLIKYTPRNERSSTKKLLDAFKNEIKSSDIEELDLASDVADLFLEKNSHQNRKKPCLKWTE